MSLSCFFGVELKPDGLPFTPIIPPRSSLVVTQVCVTGAFPTGGPVTLSVQSHNIPQKIAVATLCPDRDVFHCQLQLIFSEHVSFFLEPAADGAAPVASKPGKGNFGKHSRSDSAGGSAGSAASGAGSHSVGVQQRPHVHISGYYECDEFGEDGQSSEDDDDSDENDDEFARPEKRKKKGTGDKRSKKRRRE